MSSNARKKTTHFKPINTHLICQIVSARVPLRFVIVCPFWKLFCRHLFYVPSLFSPCTSKRYLFFKSRFLPFVQKPYLEKTYCAASKSLFKKSLQTNKGKKANIRSRGNILRYIMLLLYKDFGKKIAVIREKTEIERTWRKNCKISKTTLLHAQPQQEEQTLFLCRLVLLYKTLANHFWENFLVIQQRKTKLGSRKIQIFSETPPKNLQNSAAEKITF